MSNKSSKNFQGSTKGHGGGPDTGLIKGHGGAPRIGSGKSTAIDKGAKRRTPSVTARLK